MIRAWKQVVRFLQDDEGPTAVEYAVLLALIILVCFVAVQSLGTAASKSFDSVVSGGGFGGGT
jgi:pilus assembly protein Flp/PilA